MVAFLSATCSTTTTDLSWRIILGTSTFIAVVLFLARLGMPESPRWLWSVGRNDEARAIAHKYMPEDRRHDDVEHEDTRKGSFGMLFSQEYWRATTVHLRVLVLRRRTVLRDRHLRRQRAGSSTAWPAGSPAVSGCPRSPWPGSWSRSC